MIQLLSGGNDIIMILHVISYACLKADKHKLSV